MSDTDRQTLPLAPVENIEDEVAPPWRCQQCVKKNQYAVQRILEVVRGEGGQFYLLKIGVLGLPLLGNQAGKFASG